MKGFTVSYLIGFSLLVGLCFTAEGQRPAGSAIQLTPSLSAALCDKLASGETEALFAELEKIPQGPERFDQTLALLAETSNRFRLRNDVATYLFIQEYRDPTFDLVHLPLLTRIYAAVMDYPAQIFVPRSRSRMNDDALRFVIPMHISRTLKVKRPVMAAKNPKGHLRAFLLDASKSDQVSPEAREQIAKSLQWLEE